MPNFGVKEVRYEKLVRKTNFVHVKHYLKPVLIMKFNYKKVGVSEKNFEILKKILNFSKFKANFRGKGAKIGKTSREGKSCKSKVRSRIGISFYSKT